MKRQTKHCYVCTQKVDIDWKNAEFLRKFMADDFTILGPKKTGCCAKHQRRVAKAIKRARQMGVVPYTPMVEK